MKLPGLLSNDSLLISAQGASNLQFKEYDDAICLGRVVPTSIFLEQDPELNNRPYLRILGELTELRNETEFPEQIDTLSFPKDKALDVDIFYSFTDQQLAELVRMGYFTQEGIDVSEKLKQSILEFDFNTNLKIIESDNKEQIPIIIADVQNSKLELDYENSGYDFSKYFESKQVENDMFKEVSHSEKIEFNDAFDDDELELDDESLLFEEYEVEEPDFEVVEEDTKDLLYDSKKTRSEAGMDHSKQKKKAVEEKKPYAERKKTQAEIDDDYKKLSQLMDEKLDEVISNSMDPFDGDEDFLDEFEDEELEEEVVHDAIVDEHTNDLRIKREDRRIKEDLVDLDDDDYEFE